MGSSDEISSSNNSSRFSHHDHPSTIPLTAKQETEKLYSKHSACFSLLNDERIELSNFTVSTLLQISS